MLLVAIAASLGACYIVSLKNAEQNIKIAGTLLQDCSVTLNGQVQISQQIVW